MREFAGTRARASLLIRDGEWHRLRHGLYASMGVCEPTRTAADHGGALACVSAARHLGFWVLPDLTEIHVWLPSGGRVHHSGCLCVVHFDEVAAEAFNLPSVPRMLRQILRCQGVESFFACLESALRQHRISAAEIEWLRIHTNAAGREAIAFARRDADSGIESLFRWRLRTLGLPITPQVRISGVGIVDFVIGDRLIVELDGKANHGDGPLRHKDLVRDAAAASRDYVTLRFDFAQVIYDWGTVEAAVVAQVSAGRHLD